MANDNVKELELNGRQYNMVDATARQSIDEVANNLQNFINGIGVKAALKGYNNSDSLTVEIRVENEGGLKYGGTLFISSRFGQTIVLTYGGSTSQLMLGHAKALLINNSYQKIAYPLKLKAINNKTLAIRFTLHYFGEMVSVVGLGLPIKSIEINTISGFDGDEINITPKDLTA